MNKKVMAIAVAGALAAPGLAFAQSSTVQIGGSIHLIYAQHNPGNSAVGKRNDYLATSEPEMFIRGEEQLGGGLSAWFQCTSSFDIVGTQTAGKELAVTTAGTSLSTTQSGWSTTNGLCGRNSGIGFKGSFGNVFAGTWDTPHKLVFNRIRGWWGGTNPFAGSAVLVANGAASNAGNGATVTGTVNTVAGTAQGSFFRRQARAWNYHSPSWSGFQIQGTFSSSNESTAQTAASQLKPRLWGLALHYDNGPLYLGAGYERHKDFNPTATTTATGFYTGGSDTSYILGAGYTFAGVFKLTGLYQNNKYEPGMGSSLKNHGYAIFADWAIAGPHSLKMQYATVDDSKGTLGTTVGSYVVSAVGAGTGAKVWGAAYSYAFSKRTSVYLEYNKMSNDTSAAFSLGISAASAGGSQTLIGGGIRHSF